jgi:hypothetical protein
MNVRQIRLHDIFVGGSGHVDQSGCADAGRAWRDIFLLED